MKFKVLTVFLALVFTSMIAISGCGQGKQPSTGEKPSAEEKSKKVIELQMASHSSETSFEVAEGEKKWIEEIEKRTDGRVKIKLHAGESLLGAREIYEGVVNGVADIGVTCPTFYPGKFPVSTAFELPGWQSPNALASSWTVYEGYKKMKEMGIDDYKDVKVLMLWSPGPGGLLTKNPVRKLEDLKGMEMRVTGQGVLTMKALGVSPVNMTMPEAYLGLQQGIVDGMLGPAEALLTWKLAEVVRYYTFTPFLYNNFEFMMVMNKDTWNSLPPDIQKVFEEVSEEYVTHFGKLYTDYNRKGLEYGQKEHGVEVINLSDDEKARWLEHIKPVVDEWIKSNEAKGIPAKKVVDLVRELDANFAQKYSNY